MTLKLYPFQQQVVRDIRNTIPATYRGVVVSLPTGGGKTVVGIKVACRPRQGYTLIVVPKSLTLKWADEIRRWEPDLSDRVHVVDGTITSRIKQLNRLAVPGNILITNYATIQHVAKRQCETRTKRVVGGEEKVTVKYDWSKFLFNGRAPEWLVIDEAHRINNPRALLTQAVLEGLPCDKTLLLTATPIDDKPSQYWTLLTYADPKGWGTKYPTFWRFVDEFEVRVRTDYDPYKFVRARNLDRLHEQLEQGTGALRTNRPVVIRLKKEDILPDLPPLREQVVRVPMADTQKKHYDNIFKLSVTRDNDGRLVWAGNPTVNAVRLQQIATVPAAIKEIRHPDGKVETLNLPKASGKFDYVLDALANDDRSAPVVIFSRFKTPLDVLEPILKRKGYRVVRITGDETKAADRKRAYDEINNHTADVCLLTLAGGEGIDLVGSDHIIFLNMPQTHRDTYQILSRIHRPGAERHSSLLVTYLLSEGTIDEHAYKLVMNKQDAHATLIIQAMNLEEGAA